MHLLMTEFDCPEMILCSSHDIKIQLLTNLVTVNYSLLGDTIAQTFPLALTYCMLTP